MMAAGTIGAYFNALARGDFDPQPSRFTARTRAGWLRQRKAHYKKQDKIETADKVLAMLRGFQGERIEARMFSYLRKIDPYVFEEFLLNILETQGLSILRNMTYSNDGGLDGAFVYHGRQFLLQAKRYRGHISTAHVEAFAALVEEREMQGGLFIHTGRTPQTVYPVLRASGKITLISGQKLVDLIRGKKLTL